MRSLLIYSYLSILFQWAKGAPIEDIAAPDGSVPDGTVINDYSQALPSEIMTQASDLVISKADFADILVDGEMDSGGFENITLMAVPPVPIFLFNYSTEARDYTIDPKYSAFLARISKLVNGNNFDEDQFAKEADELKSQYADIRATFTDSAAQKSPSLNGETEIFNTTAYYYKLMRYHEALLKKDAEEEFHHHDTKCVLLFMDQLEFEISMLGYLDFDGKFLLNSKNGDPKELLEKTKERERELEFRLGKLFFERSQVFEFDMREFSRLKRLVKQLDIFVNGPSEATSEDQSSVSVTKEARSIDGNSRNSLFRAHSGLKDLSTRLDSLGLLAPGMNSIVLDNQIKASGEVYDKIDRYALETSGKQVSEILETRELSKEILEKIGNLGDTSRRIIHGRRDSDDRRDELYGEDSIFTIWKDADERTR